MDWVVGKLAALTRKVSYSSLELEYRHPNADTCLQNYLFDLAWYMGYCQKYGNTFKYIYLAA